MTTRAMVSISVNLHVFDGGADGGGTVRENFDLHRGGERGRELREEFFDAIDHGDDVGAGLTLNV